MQKIPDTFHNWRIYHYAFFKFVKSYSATTAMDDDKYIMFYYQYDIYLRKDNDM